MRVQRTEARKLGLKPRQQLSPVMEKCSLVACAKSSYEEAAEDIKLMTGMALGHSSLHRLVQRSEIPSPESEKPADGLSVDGGKVRLRTPEPGACEWRDYKAVSLHDSVCNAYFQENEALIEWVQQQRLAEVVTCVGDGHDGVWNIMAHLAPEYQRREVLDWYHLVENLHKVEGSKESLERMKSLLWSGYVDEVLEELKQLSSYASVKFRRYLRKHRQRIVPYDVYQRMGIAIGSGAVESVVKRIGARIKLSGAQWSRENVGKMLRLRCAYLNRAFCVSIST